MHCIVTAGPTFEPLDEVRRLTNFSTGRLGSELANFLVSRDHDVTLVLSQHATYRGEQRAQRVESFVTTADLHDRLQALSNPAIDAVFHAAAVSDFVFGKIWQRSAEGELTEVKGGKLSTRQGNLLAELVSAPKIIAEVRPWFPKARIIGWKYEVDGNRADVVHAAERQITECLTDACVANGPAYGAGFGMVTGDKKCAHAAEKPDLFGMLETFARK